LRPFAGIFGLALLTACQAEPSGNHVAQDELIPDEAAAINVSAGRPTPRVGLSLPTSVEAQETAPELAIDRGTYIEVGVECGNPPNASWRIWNGEGLSGSTTRACKASPVVRQANAIQVEQTCIDNYSGTPSRTTFVLRVTDRNRFALIGESGGDKTFRLCAPSELPQWLREAKR
jgi:hypothetical protein